MADLPVDSIELEAKFRPDDDHCTLSGNTGYKKSILITKSEGKKYLPKPKNRPGLQKEPKSTKGASRPGLQKEPNTPNESKGLGRNENNTVT